MQVENLCADPGFVSKGMEVIDVKKGVADFAYDNRGYIKGAAVIALTTTVALVAGSPAAAQKLADEGMEVPTLIDQVGQGVRYVLESPLIVPVVGLAEGIADVVFTPRVVAEDAPAPTIPELVREIVVRGLAEAGEMTVALVALDNVIKGNLPTLAQTATVGTLVMTLPYTLLPDVLAKPITSGIKTALHGAIDIALEIGKRQEKKSG